MGIIILLLLLSRCGRQLSNMNRFRENADKGKNNNKKLEMNLYKNALK